MFVATGSVALLADLIHNFGDALTAVPLGVAFLLRSSTAEKRPGYFVVAAILDKTERVRGPARTAPWKTIEEVEPATLGWVHWHNTQRLRGELGDVPPAEFEARFTLPTRSTRP